MVATAHRVAAGNGYQYYLRQTAANDRTARGRASLSQYYSAHGEAPGRWHGSGLSSLGISVGAEVTESQMKALFGEGLHPDAEQIRAQVHQHQISLGASERDAARAAEKATRLGNKFRTYDLRSDYRKRCAEAYRAHNSAQNLYPGTPIADDVRAQIRTRLATQMFTAENHRPPLNTRELSGWVAKNSRVNQTAVAALELTFSPVKSVAALWALAPPDIRRRIEAAHQRAITDALTWLERNGLYTRLGRNGVRHVEVEGMVAACFTHRDSRAGDPELHTHVLLANKVRTRDGKWRTIDSRLFYQAVVTVSEIHDSRLEHYLELAVGWQFEARRDRDVQRVPIREVVGVPLELIHAWSQRATAINTRLDELTADFQARHQREPTPKEVYALAEQATLNTRPAKHLPDSPPQQHARWEDEAADLLGGRAAVEQVVLNTLSVQPIPRPTPDAAFIAATAERALAAVSERRSTWRAFNLRAEVERQLRGRVHPADWDWVPDQVVAAALSPQSAVARGDPDLTEQPCLRAIPSWLRRSDGTAVHAPPNSQIYTTEPTLDVEAALIELSVQPGARALDPELVDAAVNQFSAAHPDRPLNAGQVGVISSFATSGLLVHTANAPAGTGKTTAMQVLTSAWHSGGGTVLGMAPTAAAAAVLGDSIGTRAETVDKLLDVIARHSPTETTAHNARDQPPSLPQWVLDIDDRTLVIVDEHVKLGNLKRLRLLQFLSTRRATVRCIGDDRQLTAIEAGGADPDMAVASPEQSVTLSHVVRFASTGEATASIGVRDGDPFALGWYLDNDRIHAGHTGSVYDDTYTAWATDHHAGHDAIMLAPTHQIVTALNARARADRRTRTPTTDDTEVRLADGLCASVGDTVRTRRNNPRLRFGATDWVRNGSSWTVTAVHDDGSLTVAHRSDGIDSADSVRLPAEYVRAHVHLGYAATIDSAQGITADTCHVALSGHESRQQFYVAMTRGIHANHSYLVTALDGAEGSIYTEPAVHPRTAVEVLQRVLARDAAQKSAHTELRDALDPVLRIGRAVDIYLDTLGLAAEQALGADHLTQLDRAAETVHLDLTDSPAYPVLRQHLALIALTGADPIDALRTAAAARELDTADDPAAVLDWRLDPTGAHSAGTGPLSWTPGLPAGVADQALTEPVQAREQIVAALATQIRDGVRRWTPATAPAWARPLLGSDPVLLGDLAVWRAGLHIPDTDIRPTGPPRYIALERSHQQCLDDQVAAAAGAPAAARNRWAHVVDDLDPRINTDAFWPVVADKIDLAARAGLDITTLLTHAAAERPLPDEMPAAALWARLELEPSALDVTGTDLLRPDWLPDLQAVLGAEMADQVTTEAAWPRVVAAVEGATRTWSTRDLLITAYELLQGAQPDDAPPLRADQLAAALAWRIDVLQNHTPTPQPAAPPPVTPATDNIAPTASVAAEAPITKPDAVSTNTHTTASYDLAAVLEDIAHLFSAGRITAAIAGYRAFSSELSDDERAILTAVSETLYRYSFPIAVARLHWAAAQFPQHRDLIQACTPATDPHTYRPEPEPEPARSHSSPVYNHREHVDPTITPTLFDAVQAAGNDAFDSYHDASEPSDGLEPDHQNRPGPRSTGSAIDYDLAAMPAVVGLPCVDCGIERPRNATIPVPPRHSDDGLCHSCRDTDRPAIPEHEPADHLTARCAHITNTHPAAAALAMLRRDWRTLDRRGRTLIEQWLADHPVAAQSVPMLDPVQRLSDRDLADTINGLALRLSNLATEADFFAPVRRTPVEIEPDSAVAEHQLAADSARDLALLRARELDTSIRRLHNIESQLETAREELDALPILRRRQRTALQTHINTLVRNHRDHRELHERTRAAARTANRHANELAAQAERTPDDQRRVDAQGHAAAEEAIVRDTTVEALRQTLESELTVHRAEHTRRENLTGPQRRREERARRKYDATNDEFGIDEQSGTDVNRSDRRPDFGL
ncbi:MobF family relaxase [Nocardia sp. NPDC050717]|uniref:MobF family relaxase n=1 Tax=Nocardia sp. NPDC050717 TaxID=3157221 RepID=UPI0033D3CC39